MARRMIEDIQRAAAGVTLGGNLTSFKQVSILKEVHIDRQFGGIFSLQYNFDGSRVCAGFSGGGIRMYNSTTGEMIRELRPNRHGGFGIMSMRYHPKDVKTLYATTSEGNVFLINTDTGENKHIITEPQNQINTMDFSVDGFHFCTCGKDLAVRAYETKTGKCQTQAMATIMTYRRKSRTRSCQVPVAFISSIPFSPILVCLGAAVSALLIHMVTLCR